MYICKYVCICQYLQNPFTNPTPIHHQRGEKKGLVWLAHDASDAPKRLCLDVAEDVEEALLEKRNTWPSY